MTRLKSLKKTGIFFFLIIPLFSLISCWTEGTGQFTIFIISNTESFTGNYLIDGELESFKFFEGTLYEEGSDYYIYEETVDFNSIDISVTKESEASSVEIIIYQDDYQVAKEEISEYECASYDSDGTTCLSYTDTTSLYYEYIASSETTE